MKGYRFAVSWIGNNDEPEDLDVENVSGYISTILVADIFEKDPLEVAEKIVKYRKQLNAAGIDRNLLGTGFIVTRTWI